jgi:hypothetical protein
MKHITLTPDRYGPERKHGQGYESADIRVTGARRAGSTHLCAYPANLDAEMADLQAGRLSHNAFFAVQHATVIDNFGGSAAERERMRLELAVGEPFTIDLIPGVWMLDNRDQYRLEGDGVKPVPYVEEAQ